ncbi:MAG: hypothetical protein COB98_04940 [Flavobacteriaceae bacterium]|nr:MAG: hypothetical protein COB98_04940 [Flavobacteriaceae bacterium]
MKINKIAISLLLLLTYAFGFAHSAIPHVDGGHANLQSETETISAHSHAHHQHKKGETSDSNHEHLSHDNHFDANITDYMLCVLNNMEHKDANCNVLQYIPIKRSNKNLENLSKTAVIALVYSFFIYIDQPVENASYYTFEASLFKSPPLLNSPNKGPPSLTC